MLQVSYTVPVIILTKNSRLGDEACKPTIFCFNRFLWTFADTKYILLQKFWTILVLHSFEDIELCVRKVPQENILEKTRK